MTGVRLETELRRWIRFLLLSVMLWGLLAFPALADKPVAVIPPGTWHGSCTWYGGISGNGMTVTITTPAMYNFDFQIDPTGKVTSGLWNMNVATATVQVPSLGTATGSITGGGSLGGTGAFVTVSGSLSMSVDIPSLGISGFDLEIPASGGFQATTASCTVVWGDLADKAREIQQAAGFSTTVMGPFMATRTAAPGQEGVPSWEQSYVDLLDRMDALTKATDPTAAEVSSLVIDIEKFQANLIKGQSCPDLPSSFQKGKQPYTWFVEKYTEMLSKLLDDPSAYSGGDISEMLFAAIQLGAVGSAAPDEAAAAALEAKFKAVLDQKLDADLAAGDKKDALYIYLAASQAGYTDLAAKAHDFAL